ECTVVLGRRSLAGGKREGWRDRLQRRRHRARAGRRQRTRPAAACAVHRRARGLRHRGHPRPAVDRTRVVAARAGGVARGPDRHAVPGRWRWLAPRAEARTPAARLAPRRVVAGPVTTVRSIRRRLPADAMPGDAGREAAAWPAEIPPLLRRIYAARGALDIDSARPRLADLLPPDGLLDLERATA